MASAVPSSAFAHANWLRLVGAGLVGLGLGMLSSRLVLSVASVIVGVALALCAPWAPAAVSAGRAGSAAALPAGLGLSSIPALTWFAMLLCAAAGAVAGAAPGNGTREVVAVVLAVAAAGLLLWRPEVILLVVAAFPWIDWAARHTLGGLGPLWDDALLVVSVGLVLWSLLALRRAILRPVPITLPVLVLLAAALASIVLRRVPNDVGLYALRVLFEPILFYFIGFLMPKDKRWVRWTVAVFLVTCTGLALHGLYQYATHAPMPADWVDTSETGIAVRAYSVVQNPNVLGALLVMGALISVSLALSRALRGAGRVSVAAAGAVQLAGLGVTFSRGAWLGLVIGLLAMVVLAYRRYLGVVLAAGVVAWFAAPRVFIQRLLFTFTNTYMERSSAGMGRIFRWDTALSRVAEHPLFGVGLGTFGGTAAYMFGYWALWVDNIYLQMAAEGGLVLLSAFVWLLLRGGKGLVRGHRVAGDAYGKALTAGMFGAFLGVCVANAFEADWETMAVGVEFWFLAGLVTSGGLTLKPGGDAELMSETNEGRS